MQNDEEQPILPDKRILVCNYGVSTSACAKSALCYIIQQSSISECFKVLARSRSGRWIMKWGNWDHFYNVRHKVIPPQHPRYNDSRLDGALSEFNPDYTGNKSQLSNAEAQARRREMQENKI